uniref:Uncharacterized protein n=1 Tax=Anopheles quadriannulatus TaxID=34691 RepID=A0A182X6Y1_ANOQN
MWNRTNPSTKAATSTTTTTKSSSSIKTLLPIGPLTTTSEQRQATNAPATLVVVSSSNRPTAASERNTPTTVNHHSSHDQTIPLHMQSSRLYQNRRLGGAGAGTGVVGGVVGDQCEKPPAVEEAVSKSNGELSASEEQSSEGGEQQQQRLYGLSSAMPPACSLLESYVTGTGSPLRNLYCQCKHHHEATQ